jgi:ACT domain-containing protein
MQGKIVVTVIGNDKVGIVAGVTKKLQDLDANIVDISQTIFENEIFAMIMLVNGEKFKGNFDEMKKELSFLEEKLGVKIYVQHEDIFKAMHRI